jgi:hypothetical protein
MPSRRQRFFALNKVKKILVRVLEKCQAIALRGIRFTLELHALGRQLLARRIEIVDSDCNMSHTWRAHRACGALALCGNDLDQSTIWRFHKVVAGVFVANFELQICDIPLRQSLGIRRCDGKMFNTCKHIRDCSNPPTGALKVLGRPCIMLRQPAIDQAWDP